MRGGTGGIDLQRALDVRGCLRGTTGLQREHAEQVQRVEVARLACEQGFVAGLRLRQAPGLVVRVGLRQRLGRRGCRSGLRLPAEEAAQHGRRQPPALPAWREARVATVTSS